MQRERRAPLARWRAAYRLLRLVLHVLLGCAIQALVFPLVSHGRELDIIRRWSRRLLAILNVRLQVHGKPPAADGKPTMIVANHVSWLDVWVIHAACPVRFVAKSDIRRWPLVGWLVARAGTIFIERSRRHDTARINHHIMQVLNRGEPVGVFPEGTTSDGSRLGPFHASLFQPALGAGARVATAAIRYPLADGRPNPDAAYTGERSLLESLKLILAHKRLQASLTFAGVVEPHGKTRRELARECERLIAAALNVSPPRTTPGTSSGPPGAAP